MLNDDPSIRYDIPSPTSYRSPKEGHIYFYRARTGSYLHETKIFDSVTQILPKIPSVIIISG